MKKSLFGKIMQNHSLAMILCCAIPLILIMVLSLAGNIGSWGYLGIMLLCPLLHMVMMRGHHSHADRINTGAPSVSEMDRMTPAPEVAEGQKGNHDQILSQD